MEFFLFTHVWVSNEQNKYWETGIQSHFVVYMYKCNLNEQSLLHIHLWSTISQVHPVSPYIERIIVLIASPVLILTSTLWQCRRRLMTVSWAHAWVLTLRREAWRGGHQHGGTLSYSHQRQGSPHHPLACGVQAIGGIYWENWQTVHVSCVYYYFHNHPYTSV